jgi:hypothetical protein
MATLESCAGLPSRPPDGLRATDAPGRAEGPVRSAKSSTPGVNYGSARHPADAARPRRRGDRINLANVRVWHTASIRCGAKVRTRSERSGHAAAAPDLAPLLLRLELPNITERLPVYWINCDPNRSLAVRRLFPWVHLSHALALPDRHREASYCFYPRSTQTADFPSSTC